MWIVVNGGSGSGKSAYAESRCMELDPGEKIYIATMEPYDEESFRRIDRHREMRKYKNFQTIECYRHVEDVCVPAESTVLLECMSNLTANEIFHPEGRGDDSARAIIEGVKKLASSCRNLVVVTNNVFDDGVVYDEGTMNYLRILGEINAAMGRMADETWDVVCGIPVRQGM